MDSNVMRKNENPIDLSLRDHFGELIEKHGLSHLREDLFIAGQNCIYLAGLAPDGYDRVGCSKLGGLPDLPSGFEWPEESAFLAQLNLTDIAAFDCNHLLPASGMLYFFLGSDEVTENIPGHVFWSDVEERDLRRAQAPQGYNSATSSEYEGGDTNVVYEPFVLSLKQSISLPCYGSRHYWNLLGDDPEKSIGDGYEALQIELDLKRESRRTGLHQLLGYPPSLIEDADVLACFHSQALDPDFFWLDLDRASSIIEELEGNKSRSNHQDYLLNTRKAQKEQLRSLGDRRDDCVKQVDDWLLLLNLDSDLNAGMCFWDAGRVHFLIHKSDLVRKNFEKLYTGLFTT